MTQAKASPEIGKSIEVGGVKTNYHEAGSGTPVILVHGSGPGVSAWANWQFAIPYLAQKLHVFAYDQLGFGYTDPAPNQSYSLERKRPSPACFPNHVRGKWMSWPPTKVASPTLRVRRSLFMGAKTG